MTSHHSVFIHPGHPVEALVSDVAPACGGRLRRAVNGPADYVVSLSDATLEVEMEHEYEEDKGIPFERYQVVLTVRESNGARSGKKSSPDRSSANSRPCGGTGWCSSSTSRPSSTRPLRLDREHSPCQRE
ncbi:hypothetical protein SHKM778_27770 [Streptomyces sp. KM77-8]|uniref:Uncharacterized protein n=1 Tax=Streptomyces haneummycinicus TaxID=3074435 RepID=A0AAT9HG46_9ACTN